MDGTRVTHGRHPWIPWLVHPWITWLVHPWIPWLARRIHRVGTPYTHSGLFDGSGWSGYPRRCVYGSRDGRRWYGYQTTVRVHRRTCCSRLARMQLPRANHRVKTAHQATLANCSITSWVTHGGNTLFVVNLVINLPCQGPNNGSKPLN